MEYNPSKLLKELKAAGLPVEGTDSDGNIRWVQDPTANEVAAAGSVKAAHNPIETPKGPFKQEFLAEMVRLGDDKLAKLNKLINDPQVGLFLQVCLNDTGSFNPILINKLKEHVIADPDLGDAFWQDIESVYQKVRG